MEKVLEITRRDGAIMSITESCIQSAEKPTHFTVAVTGDNGSVWNLVDDVPLYMEYIGDCGPMFSQAEFCSLVGDYRRNIWIYFWCIVFDSLFFYQWSTWSDGILDFRYSI